MARPGCLQVWHSAVCSSLGCPPDVVLSALQGAPKMPRNPCRLANRRPQRQSAQVQRPPDCASHLASAVILLGKGPSTARGAQERCSSGVWWPLSLCVRVLCTSPQHGGHWSPARPPKHASCALQHRRYCPCLPKSARAPLASLLLVNSCQTEASAPAFALQAPMGHRRLELSRASLQPR